MSPSWHKVSRNHRFILELQMFRLAQRGSLHSNTLHLRMQCIYVIGMKRFKVRPTLVERFQSGGSLEEFSTE
jgi:hypothetical protein